MEQNSVVYTAHTPHAPTYLASWLEAGLYNHALTFTLQVNQQVVTVLINHPRDLAQIVAEGMQLGTEIYARYHWSMMQGPNLAPFQSLPPPSPVWEQTPLHPNVIRMALYPPPTPNVPWIQPYWETQPHTPLLRPGTPRVQPPPTPSPSPDNLNQPEQE